MPAQAFDRTVLGGCWSRCTAGAGGRSRSLPVLRHEFGDQTTGVPNLRLRDEPLLSRRSDVVAYDASAPDDQVLRPGDCVLVIPASVKQLSIRPHWARSLDHRVLVGDVHPARRYGHGAELGV